METSPTGSICLLKNPWQRDFGSITVKKIVPVGDGEHRRRRATTLNIYAGTMEFDQQSAGITTPSAPVLATSPIRPEKGSEWQNEHHYNQLKKR